ncbi:MAG: hypothetical protein AAF741_19365 [Bacteroidota bacterium]
MKTAKIIFISACVFLCIWPVFRMSSVNSEYRKKGDQSSFVLDAKAPYFDTIIANGTIVEHTGHFGYFDKIWTSAGIHLIHDPSLSTEYIASGPESVMPYFSTSDGFNGPEFKFTRPVLIDKPVEVRMNINNHPGVITLRFSEHGGSGAIPNFTTLGAIAAKVVAIHGCAQIDGPIQLDTDIFYQADNCPDMNFTGDIGRLQARLGFDNKDYSSIAVDVIDLEPDWPAGRTAAFRADSIHMWYGFDRQSPKNVIKLLDATPDTIYLPKDAILDVEWRYEDDELIGLDTALVVRRDL